MILNEGKETSLKCNECVFVASCQIHLINHIRHVHNRENGYGKEDNTWKEAKDLNCKELLNNYEKQLAGTEDFKVEKIITKCINDQGKTEYLFTAYLNFKRKI